jgi:DNA repair exonuclease SbcCD ATPase subunit
MWCFGKRGGVSPDVGRHCAPGGGAPQDNQDAREGLHERRPSQRTRAPACGSGKPADAQTPQPAPTDEKKTEAYWKQRLQAERDALSRAQIFAEALQSRINALTTDFAARSDPAQRDVIASDRQKALAELDRVKKEIQGHQKAITDIQEEARRAGVPAGWVR